MTVLTPQLITDPAFLDYGQPITAVGDLTPYSDHDANLFFDSGAIRFYIMRLEYPGLVVEAMTRHFHCSQCLASAEAQPWWIAVAAPDPGNDSVNTDSLALFRIEPRQALKLHPGTWHAGPYFTSEIATFYNLELADTKVSDHGTRHLEIPISLQLS